MAILACPKCNIPGLSIPPPPEVSPISPLLINNDPPRNHEEGIAQQVIASSTIALVEVEAILAKVHRMIEELKHRQKEYQEQIRLHESVISKARQIPSDVLSEIFLQAAVNHGDSTRWCKEIWAVTQVCSRWRAAALSSPRLWSVLPKFDLDPEFPTGDYNYYPLRKSLERSASLPLRLIVHNFGWNSRDEDSFLNIFLPHFHRVAHLTLVNPCKAFPLLPNVQAFPSLKSIVFAQINWFHLESQHIAQTAPLLQELEISCDALTSTLTNLQEISVPWSQLRKVSVSKIELDGAEFLLQAATSLEECTLSLVSHKYSLTTPTPFSSKHLGRLCIEANSSDVVEKFFEHAKIPSLSKLSITCPEVDLGCLSAFILRSSCTLTLLQWGLPSSAVTQDDLRVFSLLPEVTDLRLGVGDGFRIDSLLKFNAPHPPLLPKLRHLFIETNNLTPLVNEVDPSTFRNKNSPVVLSETVAAIDTIILRTFDLDESARGEIFHLLDCCPKTNVDRDRVLLWSKHLGQMCTPHREGVPRITDDAADLGRIISEMEAHRKIHAHFLIDTDIIDNLHHLLEQSGENAGLKPPHHHRLSAILGEWEASVHAYLNSVGWMKCGSDAFVYAKRRGSLVARVVGKRGENPFASFGMIDRGVILP